MAFGPFLYFNQSHNRYLILCFDRLFFILVGIHLRQKEETQSFAVFSYALAPIMSAPVQIDWKIVSVQPIVSQHILCHQLQPGENLENIFSLCESDTTKALILVNSEPGFTVSGDYQWSHISQPSYPVCVMQRQEGEQLLEMVQRFEVGEVFARVESTSMTETEAKRVLSPVDDSLSLELTAGSKFGLVQLCYDKMFNT